MYDIVWFFMYDTESEGIPAGGAGMVGSEEFAAQIFDALAQRRGIGRNCCWCLMDCIWTVCDCI